MFITNETRRTWPEFHAVEIKELRREDAPCGIAGGSGVVRVYSTYRTTRGWSE
jgi:hypothetical protein